MQKTIPTLDFCRLANIDPLSGDEWQDSAMYDIDKEIQSIQKCALPLFRTGVN